jgi:hypothetical protein
MGSIKASSGNSTQGCRLVFFVCIQTGRTAFLALLALKLDAIKIQSAITDGTRDSRKRRRTFRCSKFNLNPRANLQVCHGEQSHAALADIDSECVHGANVRNHANGRVQQLALAFATVLPGNESGEHRQILKRSQQASAQWAPGGDYERFRISCQIGQPWEESRNSNGEDLAELICETPRKRR